MAEEACRPLEPPFEVLEPGLDEAIEAAKRLHRVSFESGEMQEETRRFLAARGGRKDG